MSAADYLHPAQFQHGSTEHFSRGQIIDPSEPHGTNFTSSDPGKMYMDEHRSKAVMYAGMQDARLPHSDSEVYHSPGSYRSVYTVQPLGTVSPDAKRTDQRYDPEDHATAWETSGKVRVVAKHIISSDEFYGGE